jgi:hypothetical protein
MMKVENFYTQRVNNIKYNRYALGKLHGRKKERYINIYEENN